MNVQGENMNTLFIGNGINQLAGIAPSWNTLLSEITGDKDFSMPESLLMTLGFELFIQNYLKKNSDVREFDIKKRIASGLKEKQDAALRARWPSHIHDRLLKKGFKQIVTTNYDYFIEYAIDHHVKLGVANTAESLYSLGRYREAKGVRIYHVHGEISRPNSICLGYEHYVGSVQRIRDELCKSCGKKRGDFHLAKVLTKEEERIPNRWHYAFFEDDIDIIGFGLDASELDVWWLLNYRAKLIREFPDLIHNTITYYETGSFSVDLSTEITHEQYAKDLKTKQLHIQKRDLLNAFAVKYVQCEGSTYAERYNYAIKLLGGEEADV